MKRLIVFMTITLVIGVGYVSAQSDAVDVSQIDISALFSTFAGFSAGVIVLTGLLCSKIKFLGALTRTGRSVLSWVIAGIVGTIGAIVDVGIFSQKDWMDVFGIIISFAVGSNVIYNITWFRELLDGIKITPKKRTEQ